MVREPFFIVGAERSGTTLLRLMLDGHGEIACHPEFEFVVDLMKDDGSTPPIEEYGRFLATNRIFQQSGRTIDRRLTYHELVDGFLEDRRRRTGKRVVGATVHRCFDRLLHLWPDARFIHLVRDGRDVARSRIARGWGGNAWSTSRFWLEAEVLWDQLRGRLPPERWRDVRYEELVCDPHAVLDETCRFLGVRWDGGMLDYTNRSDYGPPDPRLCFQWKEKLDKREIQRAEARIGPMLENRRYALSGLPTIHVGLWMDRWLRAQNRIARYRASVRKFGLRLQLAETVSRRLGMSRWHDDVQRRIHAIANAQLD